MLDRLSNLDRRWLFLAMALAVGVPILMRVRVPESASPMTQQAFNVVDELPAGSRVLISLDYDPAGEAELGPMAAAITRHAATKRLRIYYMTLWPAGPEFIKKMEYHLKTEFPEMIYGKDYVNLGFRAGEEGVIKVISRDLRGSYASDSRRTPLDSIEMTRDVRSVQDMDLIVTLSGGKPGTDEWVLYASDPFDIKTLTGVTGVQTPKCIPYLPNQLQGILGSVKAGAEYESLLLEKYPGIEGDTSSDSKKQPRNAREAQRRMGPQLVAHLLMIVLILAGNLFYFLNRS